MVRVAVGQLCSTPNVSDNLSKCESLVARASAAGAKALFLPETIDFITSSSEETLKLTRPFFMSEFVYGLEKAARQNQIAIHVGIHDRGADHNNKVKNCSIWIDEDGEFISKSWYQKIHLFDVDIEDGPYLKESDIIEEGREIKPPFDTPIGRVGTAICFDLRFPEISLALRRHGAQIITYSSAFTVPTGRAHWEILVRARAIETQSYVIAAAQVGRHCEKRESYGHSMIVNPWGEVMAQLGGAEDEGAIAIADIDLEYLEKVRREMPLVRRTEVYQSFERAYGSTEEAKKT